MPRTGGSSTSDIPSELLIPSGCQPQRAGLYQPGSRPHTESRPFRAAPPTQSSREPGRPAPARFTPKPTPPPVTQQAHSCHKPVASIHSLNLQLQNRLAVPPHARTAAPGGTGILPVRSGLTAIPIESGYQHSVRFCLTNSGTGISPRRVAYGDLPVCKSEDDGLEARPTKSEEHSFDPSDRT